MLVEISVTPSEDTSCPAEYTRIRLKSQGQPLNNIVFIVILFVQNFYFFLEKFRFLLEWCRNLPQTFVILLSFFYHSFVI